MSGEARVIVLGCGTSTGVPAIGCTDPVCLSDDPRNKRLRPSILVQNEASSLLVDTGPDLRQQALVHGIRRVDAVVYTHFHADHTHGIDDLRALSAGPRGPLPLFGPADTLERMRVKFAYVFDPTAAPIPGSAMTHVAPAPLAAGETHDIGGIPVLPIRVWHGPTEVFGYRFGKLAYLTDLKRVDEEAFRLLDGVEVLVLGALFRRPHPTHMSIPEAVATAQALGVRQTWLTHLTHETGHAELEAELPPAVRPAYDGLVIEA